MQRSTSAPQRSALVPIGRALDSERPAWLEGYSTKVLDGHCLGATEHRTGELREEAGAALPGKSLAVLDPELGLITDVVSCEDGHAQERRLLGEVFGRVEPGELWIADRNFATHGFLRGIAKRGASFVIREHSEPAVEGGRAGEEAFQELTDHLEGELETRPPESGALRLLRLFTRFLPPAVDRDGESG